MHASVELYPVSHLAFNRPYNLQQLTKMGSGRNLIIGIETARGSHSDESHARAVLKAADEVLPAAGDCRIER